MPGSSKGLKKQTSKKLSIEAKDGEGSQLPPAIFKPDGVLDFAFFMAKNLNADVLGGLLRTIAKFLDTM